MTEETHHAHSHEEGLIASSHDPGEPNSNLVITSITMLIVVAVAVVAFFSSTSVKQAPGPAALPELTVVVLSADACGDCKDISQALRQLDASNLIIVNSTVAIAGSSKEGKGIIAKNGITKLPAAVITSANGFGNAASLMNSLGAVRKGAAYVFETPSVPYFDVSQSKVRGRVDLIYLNASGCIKCYDFVNPLMQQLASGGITIGTAKTVSRTDPEFASLASKYSINWAPAILLSEDISLYPGIASNLKTAAVKQSDGYYLIIKKYPPYIYFSNNTLVGSVSMIELSDSSCKNCSNISIHDQVFARLGLLLDNTSQADISTSYGKELVSAYNITLLPTILLSQSASGYDVIQYVWPKLGVEEPDGWLLLTRLDQLGNFTYENLSSHTVITNSS